MKEQKNTILTLIAGIAIGVILLLTAFNTWQVLLVSKQSAQNSANVTQIANFLNEQIKASQQAKTPDPFTSQLQPEEE